MQQKAQNLHPHTPHSSHSPHTPHTERIYVKVNSDFDTTGYMQPRTITWDNGRVFNIDSVQDFRPASFFRIDCDNEENEILSHGDSGESDGTSSADCYTVIIQGETRHLFFERSDPSSSPAFGRWFVEQTVE